MTKNDETNQVVKTVNMVNGLDFGDRTKLKVLQSGNLISFFFVSGNIQTIDISDLSQEVKDDAANYGLIYKIKNSLASKAGIEEVEDEVSKQIEGLKSGNFFLRANSTTTGGGAGLTPEMEAFARVKCVQEGFTHWADFRNYDVVKDIVVFWKSLGRAQRRTILSNSSVMAMLLQVRGERGIKEVEV